MKKQYFIILTLCLLLATSCGDWLNVQPNSQVEDSELFSDEQGFKEALSGVYSSMVNESAYGKELTFGAMAILGQEWDNYPSSRYANLSEYDYGPATSTSIISSLWNNQYNSIANVNHILGNIDSKEKMFRRDNFNIIKGEALALRAFLHFDLLRCFGVSFAVNPQMPSIPYVKAYNHQVSEQLSVEAVTQNILYDLTEAEDLLKKDPILTGEKITESIDNGYLLNRQVHLNYYAVKGLEARVYLWAGQYQKALDAANVVINSGKFQWADPSLLQDRKDNSMATEQLFGLNDVNLQTLSDSYFNLDNGTSTFSVNQPTLLSYYDNQTADYRYLYLFRNSTNTDIIEYRYSQKFTPSEGDDPYYTEKIPLLRLAEMYLIKAECLYRLTGSGLETLNLLRAVRNVAPIETEPADFFQELIREYRRELIGEGQLFFLYKRLNQKQILRSDADIISLKGYTFPLPQDETTAAIRQNNR